jgi:hypothetical protein
MIFASWFAAIENSSTIEMLDRRAGLFEARLSKMISLAQTTIKRYWQDSGYFPPIKQGLDIDFLSEDSN